MPVSLCEWRVRIGTFVHWIRDYEIKERKEKLLKERIRLMKVLCERIKAKRGDSDQDSKGDNDGESREDSSSPMKRKQCPHKSTNIQSSGDSYINDLLTSCDQCMHDLLTTSHCCSTALLTPADGCIRELLNPCDNGVKDMITPDNRSLKDLLRSEDYNVKDLITQEDHSVKDLITQEYHSVKDLITPEDCSVKDLITPEDCSVKDLITPEDCSVKYLITPEDCSVKDLITPEYCSVKDLITPEDCSVKDLITPEDCSVKDLITPEDCSIKDLITPEDCSVEDLITPKDCSVRDLITPEDCSVKDLFMPDNSHVKGVRDLIPPGYQSVGDIIRPTPGDCSMNNLITSQDCSARELITPEDCSIKDLITPEHDSVKGLISPDNSHVKGVFGQNVPEFNFSSALSQIKPRSKELKKSNDQSVHVLRTVTDENTELVIPFVESNGERVTESCSTHHHDLSDTSFKEHLSTNKSLTRNKLNNNVHEGVKSYSKEKQSPSQCSVKEQLTSSCSETHKGLRPRLEQSDHLSVGLRESAVSVGEDLLQLSDFFIHEPRRSGDSLINDNCKTREPYTSAKEQHAGPGTFTNERPIRTNAVIEDQVSSESCKQFQTLTDTPVEETSSAIVPDNSRDHGNNKRHGKAKPNGTCTSLCPGSSLNSKTDLIPEEMPPISELLLLRSGDVELNPGPRQGPRWSLDLERELKSLVDEISPEYYTVLCNSLGFGRAQSKSILSKNLLDVPESLFEIICSWGVKQRDGTNYKEVLAGKLRSVNLDALGRKLLQDGYRMTEPPAPDNLDQDLDPQDTPQPLIDMTEEQVIKCGEDLKIFYLEEICKIKPDPLDFTSVLEFERIYTNLTLLNSKTPLDYTELLTIKVNRIPPKRLMVEGEGGVGKTTFCSKIAWDWANGSSQFNQFSWVLVIPLRKVIKGQTVGDIMKNYLSDSNSVTPAQIDNYIRSQPTKVLIVLDGLDEYDGDLFCEEGYDISKILRRKKFKECTVLVTTRPWRADQIKCSEDLSRSYAFIAVKGFSPENVSSYIKKYFVSDKTAGSELIQFIEVNDVIKENMAPFPIYVAMLCILWENSDFEKREKIRRLKTFSQLFDQMVMFLKDHYASKNPELLRVGNLEEEMENINSCLLEIGSIAFQGLLTKKLTFTEEDFISCKKAMETCCRVGVLSRENQNISRWKRTLNTRSSVTTSVFFPHKLFQEYIAALHLDSLYDTGREEYNKSLDKVVSGDSQEFRYLLYFTASRGPEIGLDIVNKIQQNVVQNDYYPYQNEPLVWILEGDYAGYTPTVSYPFPGRGDEGRRRKGHFLVDITFEAYNEDTAKSVGRRIFADEKILTIDEDMPAHTMSGYLFVMEQHGVETLIFRGRSCGPIVSRDLADVLCSSSSLSRLEFYRTTLDEDFYRLLQDQTSSAGVTSLKQLCVDHQFICNLQRFRVTVGDLFPSLKQLEFTTLQTVTPGVVERLTHPNLSVLSIKADSTRQTSYGDVKEGEEWPVPLIGEPATLGQLFSSSFSQLTSLTFKDLVIGNIRCKAILHSLRNHKHMESISFTSCFTDEEVDSLAREISNKSGISIALKHDTAQRCLDFGGGSQRRLTPNLMDALCHQTCVRKLDVQYSGMVRRREWFSELQGKEVQSKIQTFTVQTMQLHDDQSASCCLGRFICLLPCLTDLMIEDCCFHDEFYKEIVDRGSSSKIQTLKVKHLLLPGDQSASCCLGKFICLLSCLTDVRIELCSFHDEFYKEIADRASSSKIQTFTVKCLELCDYQSASCCLGKLICLLPCLTDLTIEECSFHDEFRKEIANRASSSKIQTFTVRLLELYDYQSASCCLGKFICLLSCLTDLRIEECSFHDEFYKEIADHASSSKIQTLVISVHPWHDQVMNHSASKQLARFLCSLPCLTDLTLKGYDLHDDLYNELTSLAASSQNPYFRNKKHMGMLDEWSARKVRRPQQLINQLLQVVNPAYQHNPRSREQQGPNILQPRQSAQPSVQYQNDHQRPIHSEHQQVHQLRNAHESGSFQQQLGSCSSHPWELPQPGLHYPNDLQRGIQSDHHQVHEFTYPHGSFKELGPYHPLQSPQSCAPYQKDHQTCIQSEHEQVQHLLSDLQESTQSPFQPITEHGQLTKTHLNEFDRYFQWYVSAQHNTCNSQASQYTAESSCQGPRQRSLHSGHIDTTQDTSVGQGQIDAIQTHDDDYLMVSSSEYINSRTSLYRGGHSIGMKPMYEYDDDPDRPSTSGLSSAGIPTGPYPWEGERIPSHRKRIYSDSDGDYDDGGVGGGDGGNDDGSDDASTTAESLERRPRKRRQKTDRNPASP